MTKRKRYSAEFKAKKYGGHPTMISGWIGTVIENMAPGAAYDRRSLDLKVAA